MNAQNSESGGKVKLLSGGTGADGMDTSTREAAGEKM